MTREELTGRWKWVDSRIGEESVPMPAPSSVMQLNSDGSAVLETDSSSDEASWEWVDQQHFKIKLKIAPQPDVPGLEDGAIEVMDYEVVNFSYARMEAMQFDYEFSFIYERIG